MSTNKHSADWKHEQQRITTVIARIHTRQAAVKNQIDEAHKDTQRIERSYGDATKVNITEIDDQMETNAAVQQQKQMVALSVENEQILQREEATLARLEPAPYFGRIDITDPDGTDTLYIGTGSLQNAAGDFLVYDWRAPIASIYYNGVLGDVTYATPNGNRAVNLARKRQYRIEAGTLEHMFDTSETVGDEMLQSVLGEQTEDFMRNIVSTIQREQNIIIRDTASDLLIVQGAAGSGKTSAILQRIAYLLYHSRQTLASDQIVLFSPNRLFATYISEVLPSLGEKNMIQTTLGEFLSKRFSGLQVETLFDRFEQDAASLPAATKRIRNLKEGAAFMAAATAYAKQPHELAFSDIELDGAVFFSKETMAKIYAKMPAAMKPADKFAELKKTLMKRLNQRIRIEAHQDWVDEAMAGLSEDEVRHYIGTEEFEDGGEELAAVARAIVAERFAPVYTALFDDYALDVYGEYAQFLSTYHQTIVEPEVWAEMVAATTAHLEQHRLRIEDTAPIMLIRDILTGTGQNHGIMSVFVDEMQDYAPALLLYIHHAFPNAKLTFLGDQKQDIFTSNYADTPFLTSLQNAFGHMRTRLIELNRAYRSSAPITKFAAAILPSGGTDIQAFARDGQPVTLEVLAREDYSAALIKHARALASKNRTVAILTRTQHAANGITAQVQLRAPELNARLLTPDDHNLGTGVIVLPVYLAKGLEFDAVIAHDLSAATYHDESDRDVIYTLATRALHTLVLLAIDAPGVGVTAALADSLSTTTEASHV